MTYNVFGGTLNLAQSIIHFLLLINKVDLDLRRDHCVCYTFQRRIHTDVNQRHVGRLLDTRSCAESVSLPRRRRNLLGLCCC